jgi:tetratricopeptide (TPR) repeat protein
VNERSEAQLLLWGHRAAAALVFLVTLVVYTLTLTTSVPFWDSGEFIATSYVLGIPHPPGTPLYVLIGRLFAMAPLHSVAYSVNWLSALASSLAMLFTFLLTVRFIRHTQGPERDAADEVLAWVGGAAAAFFAAFSKTFWDSAIEAEVYALSSWMQVFILWLGLRWWEGLERGEGDNRLLLAWYLCFLCVGIHLGTFLVMPALVLLVLMVNWRSLVHPRNLAWAAVLAIAGLSVHLYLYIRAKANPSINEGDPETWEALRALLMREQYGSRPILPRQAPWSFQFQMYFRYFAEQYVLHAKLGQLAWALPAALGIFGAVGHLARSKKTWVVQATTFFLTSVGLLVYLNFTDHEVRERDYFYTSSFHFFAIWIGMGLYFLIEWAREAWPAFRRPAVLLAASAAALAVSFLPMIHHWFKHDRRDFYVARDYAYNMLQFLEPGAFVFTNGDNDTFPLWYLQEVEGVRKDVRVINLSLLNTDWYIRQLRDEEPRIPMNVSDDQLRLVREYGYFLDAEGRVVLVNAWMVQSILAANRGKKPAYLAVTVPEHHGLDPRMVLEGIVYRIYDEPVTRGNGIYPSSQNFIDVPTVRSRLYQDFVYRGLFTEDGTFLPVPYKDENARRLSQNYMAAHLQLAYHHRRQGEMQLAIAELERSTRMFPEMLSVKGQLGVFYLEAGDTAKALEFLARESRRNPSPDLLYYYGVTLGFAGRIDEAVESLLLCARLDPTDDQAFFAAFSLLNDAGRREEAKRVLEELLAVQPQHEEARRYLDVLDTTRRRSWTGSVPQGAPPGAFR